MLERLPPARRNWVLAVLAALCLWFAWSVRSALNPLLVAVLLAYILHPLVLKLERRGWSRRTAVNVIFGAAALSSVLLGLGLVIQARAAWKDVVVERRSFERIRDQIDLLIRSGQERLDALGVDVTPEPPAAAEGGEAPQAPEPAGAAAGDATTTGAFLDELYEAVRQWVQKDETRAGLTQAGVRAFGGVWALLGAVFGSLLALLAFLFLVPLYTWFLLFELERMSAFVRSYIPRDQRARWTRIGDQIAAMLGAFFRGRLLVSFLKGAVLSITLVACGVPYPLLIGMSGGFLSLVPFLGAGIGYALTFLMALLEHDPPGAVVRTGIVIAVGELTENYVLMPKILGDQLGLHPVVVLAALMVFGSAFGMFGLLLALPLTAAIVILARELLLPAMKQFAEGPRGKPGG
jgi:predicted PurR-regulated permease PerM